MTTPVSFACIQGEHWACPGHLGVVGFPCDCHCHRCRTDAYVLRRAKAMIDEVGIIEFFDRVSRSGNE